ncbi:hypothetical protein ACHAWF_003335, partial [Thalassiosira exigua]
MTSKADQMIADINSREVDCVLSILESSIRGIGVESRHHDMSESIREANHILHHLKHQADVQADSTNDKDLSGYRIVDNDESENSDDNASGADGGLQELACSAIATTDSLRVLVNQKGPKKSSGHVWKALNAAVGSSFGEHSADRGANEGNDCMTSEIPCALASLAMGLALSICSSDAVTSKMIASAILPCPRKHGHQVDPSERGKKYQKQEGSKKEVSEGNSGEAASTKPIIYSVARGVVLGLLRHANGANQCTNDKQKNLLTTIDLQILAKIESGFSVGDSSLGGDDAEHLAKAVADTVALVFGQVSSSKDANDDCVESGADLTKDKVAPVISLVSNIRPWNYVQVEKLVKSAAEMNLWYSAELLCDAAADSTCSQTTSGEAKKVMATSFPRGAPTEELLTDNLDTSLPRNSIAHLAARAIIDISLDYRLYRRADVFASKYYSFGGPERYAEARFLHACDTTTKVIKKGHLQVIDKQVERVDEMVTRVSKDLPASSENNVRSSQFIGGEVEIATMSEHIREFSLRRLRASNMHAAAIRLAKLWGMEYSQDPMQMKMELEQRRLTYLQWEDGPGHCPETSSKESIPLPVPISEPDELMKQFMELEKSAEQIIGFDSEWHDSLHGVALLQLSTCTSSLLLDIPALTVTNEGCQALQATVGKLFSGATNFRHVIGFGCKDDVKRLRASPCLSSPHWFPQNEKMYAKDLRNLIAEVCPELGGRGMNFGLSRACEAFLGKQLDKAEQCSDWLARPLSTEQREYAALDAWACAAIAAKILKEPDRKST